MKIEWFVLGASLIQAASCGNPLNRSIVCTDNFAPGISITPVDSVTGAAVQGASAIARDGAFVDSTTSPSMLAGERAGTYNVTVRKTGYAAWQKNGVKVTRDACHVRTVYLTAKLQPAP